MKKLFLQSIKLVLALTVALIGSMTDIELVGRQIKINPEATSEEPVPPDTGTPDGSTTPGGTRPGEICPNTQKPLTAIFANNGSDFTISEYPTFWFYIPYSSQQVGYIEFLLVDAEKSRTVYETAVRLIDKPGIIKITIPNKPEYTLETDKDYRWRLNLDCEKEIRTEPKLLVVEGWIRRVPITSELENQLEAVKPQFYSAYKESGIWYDAIANLAQLHFANPNDQELSAAWTELLNMLQLNWLSGEEPLVDSELLPPKD